MYIFRIGGVGLVSNYQSKHWLKVKNPAVRREAEEDWGR
jgi:hypothetical protein